MIINRLYTEPAVIEPIVFTNGLNIILGEKSDISDKRNSVGKSLCIEFINFALLKKKKDSRVSLIPEDIFSREVEICLDFEIGENVYSIKRSVKNSEEPTIFENGIFTKFEKLEDAVKFLTEKLFS